MIFGIDEVGRGPLAGPLCIGIVALDPNNEIVGLKDSKKLSEKKRKELYDEIKEKALYSNTLFIERDRVDKLNIKNATIKGFEEIISEIPSLYQPSEILIDGDEKIQTEYSYKSIIKGDESIPSIMAASIIAKVERDERMEAIDLNFPAYGFKNHKGYGTKEHLDAIKIYGPCVQHRKSFKPIKNFKFSALEAFDIYEMIIEARKLLENKNDQEIKKELSRLLEEAEFLNEEKKGKKIKQIEMLKEQLNKEWKFLRKAFQNRKF